MLALPLFHAHGLCNGLHGTLLAGASAVLLPGFTVDGVLDAATEHDATLFFGVPTMYHRLAASARAAELGRGCASACRDRPPLPAELHRGAAGRARGRDRARALRHDRDQHAGLQPLRRRAPGGDRRLPAPRASRCDLAEGSGEIEVRGPNVFGGYWQRPEATAEAFTDDGWFRTGDLGSTDDEAGYLRILGRAKELIITGGYNVYPREVEDVLCRPPRRHGGRRGRRAVRPSGARRSWPTSSATATRPPLLAHAETQLRGSSAPARCLWVDVAPPQRPRQGPEAPPLSRLDPESTRCAATCPRIAFGRRELGLDRRRPTGRTLTNCGTNRGREGRASDAGAGCDFDGRNHEEQPRASPLPVVGPRGCSSARVCWPMASAGRRGRRRRRRSGRGFTCVAGEPDGQHRNGVRDSTWTTPASRATSASTSPASPAPSRAPGCDCSSATAQPTPPPSTSPTTPGPRPASPGTTSPPATGAAIANVATATSGTWSEYDLTGAHHRQRHLQLRPAPRQHRRHPVRLTRRHLTTTTRRDQRRTHQRATGRR